MTCSCPREKGQVWTPDGVAVAMAEYVMASPDDLVFDPAVGAGAFFRAAKAVAAEKNRPLTLAGMEIDPVVLEKNLSPDDRAVVETKDFLACPPQRKFSAIVANPPYIRHHHIPRETKDRFRRFCLQTLGKTLDGRAGLHIYFLVQALTLLAEGGRLAIIMPADTCEGKFAGDLWEWIARCYRLEAVLSFTPEASPFPGVDTNPLIFFIRRAAPQETFSWARCAIPDTGLLRRWVRSGFHVEPQPGFQVIERTLSEGLLTGLSRPPCQASSYTLGHFGRVIRGVATGANDFFLLTAEQVRQTGIPQEYWVRTIGRTRDVPAPSEEITRETLDSLEKAGRPTFLLNVRGGPFETFPDTLKRYLRKGEQLGLPQRALLSQRKPWYTTEFRLPPPFLFAYLGRRHSRFICNTACVVPTNGFLCFYPKQEDNAYLDSLWKILRHPATLAGLVRVGKTYGDGAVKVEPRALEKLPIPEFVVEQSGLEISISPQTRR